MYVLLVFGRLSTSLVGHKLVDRISNLTLTTQRRAIQSRNVAKTQKLDYVLQYDIVHGTGMAFTLSDNITVIYRIFFETVARCELELYEK
jgi:hypothetical protein